MTLDLENVLDAASYPENVMNGKAFCSVCPHTTQPSYDQLHPFHPSTGSTFPHGHSSSTSFNSNLKKSSSSMATVSHPYTNSPTMPLNSNHLEATVLKSYQTATPKLSSSPQLAFVDSVANDDPLDKSLVNGVTSLVNRIARNTPPSHRKPCMLSISGSSMSHPHLSSLRSFEERHSGINDYGTWSAPHKTPMSTMELLYTENQYISDMLDLVKYYLNPLSLWITDYESTCIGYLIPELLHFHQQLLEKLTSILPQRNIKFLENPSQDILLSCIRHISSTFVEAELGFSYYYKEYCAAYGNSISLLSELKKSQLSEFLETCRRHSPARLDITDYLIKPIQRITKYPLIFKEIIKSVTPDTSEYKEVEKALEMMRNMAEEVNEVKERIENMKRTCLFMDRLVYSDKLPINIEALQLGDIALSGGLYIIFKEKSSIKAKYYGCFLFHRYLLIVKAKTASKYHLKQCIVLQNMILEDSPVEDVFHENSWLLTHLYNQYSIRFYSPKASAKSLWFNSLLHCMEASTPSYLNSESGTMEETIFSKPSQPPNGNMLTGLPPTSPSQFCRINMSSSVSKKKWDRVVNSLSLEGSNSEADNKFKQVFTDDNPEKTYSRLSFVQTTTSVEGISIHTASTPKSPKIPSPRHIVDNPDLNQYPTFNPLQPSRSSVPLWECITPLSPSSHVTSSESSKKDLYSFENNSTPSVQILDPREKKPCLRKCSSGEHIAPHHTERKLSTDTLQKLRLPIATISRAMSAPVRSISTSSALWKKTPKFGNIFRSKK